MSARRYNRTTVQEEKPQPTPVEWNGCHFTHACIYPIKKGQKYCRVHQSVITEQIKKSARVSNIIPKGKELRQKSTGSEKSIDYKRTAMIRLYRNGWPTKRIEQVFEVSEAFVQDVLSREGLLKRQYVV